MAKVCVILPAAGAGTRFGARMKILEPLAGEPVFLRSIRLFAGRGDVRQVLLVLSEDGRAEVEQRFAGELAELGVELVTGGATRTESVRNALARVADDTELVCIHDAVRPCTPAERIDAVFAEAGRTGAALLAVPVRATLKREGAERLVEATVDRQGLWAAQTPQVFAAGLLREAYAAGAAATDDAALVEALGRPVRLVPGCPGNVKITTPADLELAAAVLEGRT